jgi:hypothetical protein
MSVSAVGGGNSAWYTQAQSQPAQPEMTNTAKLFDISSSQLDQDVQSGTTLSSLASQDGVSSSSLVSAIESDLQANAPQGAQQLSSSQLQGMATNIANGTAPAGGHHGGHHHHGMGMTDATQLLDTSTDSSTSTSTSTNQDGTSQLNAGQSLVSMLAANAYANSASSLASSTGDSSQISEYS